MGTSLSSFFTYTSSSSANQRVSDVTREKVMELFYVLRANPRININKIEGLLTIIPKNEPILCLTDSTGYNILQKTVSLNHIEIVKWILSRSNVDVNRGACSLPLHIACFKGYRELVELMLTKYRARIDLESRLCWPGPHHTNCEARSGNCIALERNCGVNNFLKLDRSRSSEKVQGAVYYAIDGDHADILELLVRHQKKSTRSTDDSSWLSVGGVGVGLGWSERRRPLLHVACERGSFSCTTFLLTERPEEINLCYDEYYPIHHAVLHDLKFLQTLLRAGADPRVRTATENMSVLHVLYYRKRGSSEDCLTATKILLDSGLRELINEPDSLGNTVLHTIIVRYALEESSRFNLYQDYAPWTKWDVLHIIRFLLQQGARPSINQSGNSALACVLRHVRDWEFRYELLSMLLQEGGDPNIVGRDGSVPLMVCLVPLINKDLLHNFTHSMKVLYLNCIRLLLKHGAEVNCSSLRTELTPLHVLMFAASEYMGLMQSEEKCASFQFIKQLLELLLSFGLDPNTALGGSRTQHILLSLLELVNLVRNPSDLNFIYELSLVLLQYGANCDVDISMETFCHSQSSFYLKKSSNKVLYYYIQWLCKKEHLLLDPERRFAKIIKLYANVMGHRDLYSTLRLLHTQSAIVPVRTSLCSTLKELYSNPRSLMQQCRVVIYKQLLKRAPARVLRGNGVTNSGEVVGGAGRSNLSCLPQGVVRYLMLIGE